MKEILKTTALFIDVGNVRLKAIPQILEILMLEWTPIKMRTYGTQIGPKQKVLRDFGVLPVEVIPMRQGKNSVDLVLTIDALERLFCGHADAIAIQGEAVRSRKLPTRSKSGQRRSQPERTTRTDEKQGGHTRWR